MNAEPEDESLIPGTSEYWAAIKDTKRNKKWDNREKSIKILKDFEVDYNESNHGTHFMIPFRNTVIDFYPTTGKIYDKSTGFKERGVMNLLAYMEVIEQS